MSDRDSREDEDPLGGDSSAFMSLLNSYYDAPTDPAAQEAEVAEGNEDDIDSPQFQGEKFAKVTAAILLQATIFNMIFL